MFENSENAFFEIIKKYNPDIIFVWGNRLWKQLPNEKFCEEKNVMGKPIRFYNNKIRNIPIFFSIILHLVLKKFFGQNILKRY